MNSMNKPLWRKHTIESIHHRSILNSHVQFTTEYIIKLRDGNVGIGSAPVGETISIYERESIKTDPQRIIEKIRTDKKMGVPLNQNELDEYLQQQVQFFGRLNSFALSQAFFSATYDAHADQQDGVGTTMHADFPNICMNVLNGGRHAYTNPVLSEFSEYLLVSRNNDVKEIIQDHNEIQRNVKEQLRSCSKAVVNGNTVNKFNFINNHVWLEFLLEILQKMNLSEKYDLMIDASAGDLFHNDQYHFALTDGSSRTTSELCGYWRNLVRDYNLRFLEDPFREKDFDGWKELVKSQQQCKIIGDNLYSSHPGRIEEGAKNGYSTGVVVKPDQAGTVTATIGAITTAQKHNQFVITSHRSISTESIFVSTMTAMFNLKYIKIGPLATDYSSVLRMNELIRLTGVENG